MPASAASARQARACCQLSTRSQLHSPIVATTCSPSAAAASTSAGTNSRWRAPARRRRYEGEVALQEIDGIGKRGGRRRRPAPRRTADERDTRIALPAREIGIIDVGLDANFRRGRAITPRLRERKCELGGQDATGVGRRHRKRAAVAAANERLGGGGRRGTPAPAPVGQCEIGLGDHARDSRREAALFLPAAQSDDEGASGNDHAHAAVRLLPRHGEVLRVLRSRELIVDGEARRRGDAPGAEGRQRDGGDANLRGREHDLDAIGGRPRARCGAPGPDAGARVVEEPPRHGLARARALPRDARAASSCAGGRRNHAGQCTRPNRGGPGSPLAPRPPHRLI